MYRFSCCFVAFPLYRHNGSQPSFKQTYVKERNETENRFNSSSNCACVFCRSFHYTCNPECISSFCCCCFCFVVAENKKFDKYFLIFFFLRVRSYGTEIPESQLSLHSVILLTDWNNTLFTLAQLRTDLAWQHGLHWLSDEVKSYVISRLCTTNIYIYAQPLGWRNQEIYLNL